MKKVLISISVLATILISFFLGLYLGAENYLLANSQNQAIVLSNELRMLRNGNTQDFIEIKESSLTGQIELHDRYLNNFNWFFQEITQNSERNMKAAINYRLEYPYKFPEWWKDGWKGDITEDMKLRVSEINEAQDRMIEKYK